MDVKDLLGLSEPICKLIDAVSNGVSALSAPWMYTRMENARLRIQSKEADQRRDIALKDALAEQFKDELLTGRDKREWKNVSDVIGISADILKCLPEVSEEPVNPDWSARFFDYAKNCSDEEVKRLWGQILAGEIESPGKYSLRTLDVLRNLTRTEAQLITKYAARVHNSDFLDVEMSVLDVAKLGDIGFINDNELSRGYDIAPNEPKVFYTDSDHILICSSDTKKHISYSFHALTQVGREIMSLVTAESNDEILKMVANDIAKRCPSCKISKHKLSSCVDGHIEYYKAPIWAIG